MADIVLSMDGLLLNWLKQVGDSVTKGEIVAEFEADKATVEVEAPEDGTISALSGDIGQEMKAGSVIGQIGKSSGNGAKEPGEQPPAPARTPASAKATSVNGSTEDDGRVKASPIARNMAREMGIDLALVAGTGPNGRIVKTDVENFKPSGKAVLKPAAAAQPTYSGTEAAGGTFEASQIPIVRLRPTPPAGDEIELLDVSRMRKAIAAGTTESNQQIPTFYVTSEMDLDPLLALRAQLNASIGDKGVKISVNDMIVKAVALALRQFPNLNTHYYGEKLARNTHINIGIAVAPSSGGGVIYVVAKDADRVSLSTLAASNKEMIDRARDLKLKPDDTKGATFSTSNLGPYEVDQFTAVINPPEAGVIAIGSGRKVPVIKTDGTVGVGTRIKITLSVDHRISDGAEGGQFMFALKALIENPMRLLL